MNSFSFIIATHNNEKDIVNTYLTVLEAVSKLNINGYEIIFVNNASSDKTEEIIAEIKLSDDKVKNCYEPRLGLSYAICAGVNLSSKQYSLPLPGHDMHTSESIKNVCALAEEGSIVLGYRQDKLKSRPFMKVLTSYVYTLVCNKLFKLNLRDINGLILFPTKLLEISMDPSAGHGHAILPIVRLNRIGIKIKQVPIAIKENHKRRAGASWTWHFPKLSNIFSALKTIYLLKRKY